MLFCLKDFSNNACFPTPSLFASDVTLRNPQMCQALKTYVKTRCVTRVVEVERGPFSLVRSIEELLE